jgi:hypothetical protein
MLRCNLEEEEEPAMATFLGRLNHEIQESLLIKIILMGSHYTMEPLGDVGHVESPYFLFGDSVSAGVR